MLEAADLRLGEAGSFGDLLLSQPGRESTVAQARAEAAREIGGAIPARHLRSCRPALRHGQILMSGTYG